MASALLICSFLSLLLVYYYSPLAASLASCNENDKSILLIIRDSWGSSSPTPSWRNETDCCRHWAGVSCDPNTGRVTGLVFPADPAIGKVPTVLGELIYLQVLSFHMMPNLYGTIPDELAKLTRLRLLRISQTGVYGSIPSFFANFTALQKLDLSFNHFSGSIPSALGTVPHLYAVNIGGNNLTGDASSLFGQTKPIQQIDLSNNQLAFDLTNVEFPEKQLSLVDLSFNMIYGSIPAQIIKVTSLHSFNVSYNSLCGRIPSGGPMGRFPASSYIHNKCLCGKPLAPCDS